MSTYHDISRTLALLDKRNSRRLGEISSMSEAEWLASQYTPNTEAVQHGVRQGAANALALPQFLGDVFNAPNTFINNNLTDNPRQDYFRNFDAASHAYARDITGADQYADYARTPGNVAGDTMLQIGTEVMMPLGGGYTAIRGPVRVRRAKQAVDAAIDPAVSESRREFLGDTGRAAAAVALAPMVYKATKGVPLGSPKTVVEEAVSNVAPPGRWDAVVDEIYGADVAHVARPAESSFLRVGDDNFQFDRQYDFERGLRPDASKSGFMDIDIEDWYDLNYQLATPETRAAVDTKYDEIFDYYEDAFPGQHNEARPMVFDDIKRLFRDDPNVSAYRQERAKVRAATHGDELWEAKRQELERNLDKAEYDYVEYPSKDDEFPSYEDSLDYLEIWDDAREEYQKHLDLGERVGLITMSELKSIASGAPNK